MLLGGMTCGYNAGIYAGFLSEVDGDESKYDVSSFYQGVIASSLLFGAALGSTLGGHLSDSFGRKLTIRFSSILCSLGAISSAFSFEVWYLCLSRVLTGLGMGFIAMVCPTYIGEIAPEEYRGRLIATFQPSATAGVVIAYLFGIAFSNVTYSWRIMFGCGAIISQTFFLLSLYLPESPRWLISQNRKEEAHKILEILELPPIEANDSDSGGECSWWELLEYKKSLVLGLVLSFGAQLTGINAIIFFAPKILDEAGISSLWATLGVGCWNMITTLGATLTVDKHGRRPLMLIGNTICAVSAGIVAIGFMLSGALKSVIVLFGIFSFILGFESGPGTLYYLVLAEIYQQKIRGKATALANFEMWSFNLIIGISFLSSCHFFGESAVFLFFMGIAIFVVIYLYFFLPETKGLSLEQINVVGEQTYETSEQTSLLISD